MYVQRIADYDGTAFVSAKHAGGKGPCDLQFTHIIPSDLCQGAVTRGGKITVLHHPLSRVVLPNQEFFVCLHQTGYRETQGGDKQRNFTHVSHKIFLPPKPSLFQE